MSKGKMEDAIREYLDEIGGNEDYNGKVESVSEEFCISLDEAEGYVWRYLCETSDVDDLNF